MSNNNNKTNTTNTNNAKTLTDVQVCNLKTFLGYTLNESYELSELKTDAGITYFLFLELKNKAIGLHKAIVRANSDAEKALQNDDLNAYKLALKVVKEKEAEKKATDAWIDIVQKVGVERNQRVALYHYGIKQGNTLVMSKDDATRLESICNNICNYAELHLKELEGLQDNADFTSQVYKNCKIELQAAFNILLPQEKNVANSKDVSALIAAILSCSIKAKKGTVNIAESKITVAKNAKIKKAMCKILAAKIVARDVHFSKRDETSVK